MAALQAMDDLPDGGMEVLEDMAARIAINLLDSGEDIPDSPDEYVDIYDVPKVVFEVSENNQKQVELSNRIKSLNTEFQKLLHFIVLDHDPKLVAESLDYQDVSVYWDRRGQCLKEFLDDENDLTDEMKSDLKRVYDRYGKIRDNFLFNTDIIFNEAAEEKKKSRWIITGLISVFVPLLFFVFLFPLLIQKDNAVLFNEAAQRSGLEMTVDSVELLDNMILETEEYSAERFWLLSLQALQAGDIESCRENLESMRSADPLMFREKGRYIYRRLKRN